MNNTVYISDNFFSAGETSIRNGNNEEVGRLNLHGIFHSDVSVLDMDGRTLTSGRFKFFSNKWLIFNEIEEEIGVVKGRFFSFSKKYTYTTSNGDVFSIMSQAFSKNFFVYDEHQQEVASFTRLSSFFSSAAYEIHHANDYFLTEELITVIMGINAIEKRKKSSSSTAGADS